MSIVELHEVKCHLHYADDSNDVSLKSFIVAADAIIKITLQILDRNIHRPLNKQLYY